MIFLCRCRCRCCCCCWCCSNSHKNFNFHFRWNGFFLSLSLRCSFECRCWDSIPMRDFSASAAAIEMLCMLALNGRHSFICLSPIPFSVDSNAIMLPLILYRAIDVIQLSRPFIQLYADRQSASHWQHHHEYSRSNLKMKTRWTRKRKKRVQK